MTTAQTNEMLALADELEGYEDILCMVRGGGAVQLGMRKTANIVYALRLSATTSARDVREALEYALGSLRTIAGGWRNSSPGQLGAIAQAGIDLAELGPEKCAEMRGEASNLDAAAPAAGGDANDIIRALRDECSELRKQRNELIDQNSYADLRASGGLLGRGEAEPVGLPYGIIDPDYARFFTDARLACWGYGYALAMHGSFTRDLDLIAMPWTESACDAEKLIHQIEYRTEWKRQKKEPSQREHGRMVWTLTSPKFNCARFVDFSIVPRIPAPATKAPAVSEADVDVGAKFLCEIVRRTAWESVREGRAADHGFDPWKCFNARKDDYRDAVRAIQSAAQGGGTEGGEG